jgi:predicted nucleotidyltransferase
LIRNIEVVMIAPPAETHARLSLAALEAGKDVFFVFDSFARSEAHPTSDLDIGVEWQEERQAFQQAFVMGWITDEEVWVDIIQARNTAVHVYRQEYTEALYQELNRYDQAFRELY